MQRMFFHSKRAGSGFYFWAGARPLMLAAMAFAFFQRGPAFAAPPALAGACRAGFMDMKDEKKPDIEEVRRFVLEVLEAPSKRSLLALIWSDEWPDHFPSNLKKAYPGFFKTRDYEDFLKIKKGRPVRQASPALKPPADLNSFEKSFLAAARELSASGEGEWLVDSGDFESELDRASEEPDVDPADSIEPAEPAEPVDPVEPGNFEGKGKLKADHGASAGKKIPPQAKAPASRKEGSGAKKREGAAAAAGQKIPPQAKSPASRKEGSGVEKGEAAAAAAGQPPSPQAKAPASRKEGSGGEKGEAAAAAGQNIPPLLQNFLSELSQFKPSEEGTWPLTELQAWVQDEGIETHKQFLAARSRLPEEIKKHIPYSPHQAKCCRAAGWAGYDIFFGKQDRPFVRKTPEQKGKWPLARLQKAVREAGLRSFREYIKWRKSFPEEVQKKIPYFPHRTYSDDPKWVNYRAFFGPAALQKKTAEEKGRWPLAKLQERVRKAGLKDYRGYLKWRESQPENIQSKLPFRPDIFYPQTRDSEWTDYMTFFGIKAKAAQAARRRG